MPERTLYQFTLSPYAIKTRKVLDFKGLRYKTVEVNPFNRTEIARISGQRKVPVLVEKGEGGQTTVIADSTAIAIHAEAAYPEPPVYPRDPAERARVLLLEDWSDEQLSRTLIPFKFLTPGNAARVAEQSMTFYPATLKYRLLSPFGPLYLKRVASRMRAGRSLAHLQAEFEGYLDTLDALAAQGPFLSGGEPTVFDFAVFGQLRTMEGLTGQELILRREKLGLWYDSVAKEER